MTHRIKTLGFALIAAVSLAAAPAQAQEFSFMANMNVQASANISLFQQNLSVRFGVPQPQVQTIVQTVAQPADAYMILRTAELTRQPPQQVVTVYQTHRSKGWGAIAKEMGIKPGSPEFHALKRGETLGGGRGPAPAPAGGSAPAPVAAPAGGPPGQGGGPPPGRGHGRGHNK